MDSVLYSTVITLAVILAVVAFALAVGYVRYLRIRPGHVAHRLNKNAMPIDRCELPRCTNTYAWEADTPVTTEMLTDSAKFPKRRRSDGFDAVISSIANKPA